MTGSVGLLSDALESLVNLAGACMALEMLSRAAQPDDEAHRFGHGKAEYLSSPFEGFRILVAATSIAYAAVPRLIEPHPLEAIGAGIDVLMPGDWTVRAGHQWLERIESDIRHVVPRAHVTTHMETLEDPVSHADRALDRE